MVTTWVSYLVIRQNVREYLNSLFACGTSGLPKHAYRRSAVGIAHIQDDFFAATGFMKLQISRPASQNRNESF